MSECDDCGVEFWGPMASDQPLTDGLGNHYMGKCCPNCDAVLMRIFPNRKNGRELRDELKTAARQDPNPPPRSEMPENFIDVEDGDE